MPRTRASFNQETLTILARAFDEAWPLAWFEHAGKARAVGEYRP